MSNEYLSTESVSVSPSLPCLDSANGSFSCNDFAEATVLLLGHYSSLRIPYYIHEGLTEGFFVIAL